MKWFLLAFTVLVAFYLCIGPSDAGSNLSPSVDKPTKSQNKFLKTVGGWFRKSPKKVLELEADIDGVVAREKQLHESLVPKTSLADPKFLELLTNSQDKLLDFITQNFEQNIRTKEEFEQMRAQKLTEAVDDELPRQQQQPEQQNAQADDVVVESTAEALVALEELSTLETGTIKANVHNESKWKGQEPKLNWWAKFKTVWKSDSRIVNKQKALVKAEMKKELAQKGPESLVKKHPILGRLLKWTHCQGLFKLLKGKKELNDQMYRKVLFDVVSMLHGGIEPNPEVFNVEAILDNADESERAAQLDKIIAMLEKFSVQTLLVPFRQGGNGQVQEEVINGEELSAIKAVLTNSKLAEAVAERIAQQKAGSEQSAAEEDSEAAANRAKRAIIDEHTMQEADPALRGALIGVTIGTFGAGLILWVAYEYVRWCY